MDNEKAVCTGREGCRGGGMRCEACDLVAMDNDYMKLRDELAADVGFCSDAELGAIVREKADSILSALAQAAGAGRYKEALLHIAALCPPETGGMSDAALAGLLFNIEGHTRQALQGEA